MTPSIWALSSKPSSVGCANTAGISGSNVFIDDQWAEGQHDRYARIADYFVSSDVDIIVTSGTPPVIAAANATSAIPIVFAAAGTGPGWSRG